MMGRPATLRLKLTLCLLAASWGCEGWPPKPEPPPPPPPAPDASPPREISPLVAATAPDPGQRVPAPEPPPLLINDPPTPFGIAAALPRGEVEGFVRPTVVFERPVQPRDAAAGEVALIRPPLRGQWRWLSSTTAEFISEAPLPWSSRFIVHVPSGRRGLDGGVMEFDYLFSFRTPRVRALDGDPVGPSKPAEGIALWPTLDVLFNQAPDPELFEERAFITDGVRRVPLDIRAQTPRGATPMDRATWLKLAPREALSAARDYQLVFEAGLGGLEGPLLSEEETRWRFSTYRPLEVEFVGCPKERRPCDPTDMAIMFNNPVTAEALSAALSISPPATLTWPKGGSARRWTLQGRFLGETRYTLRLTNLSDVFGQRLKAYTSIFSTSAQPPKLELSPRAPLFSLHQPLTWPIQHSGLERFEVGVARLDARQLSRLYPAQKGKPPSLKWREIEVEPARKAPAVDAVDLASLFPNAQGGLAQLKLRWREGSARREAERLVQVTPLGLLIKRSAREATAFAWERGTGRPLAGVEISLLDGEGQLARQITDAQGLALFDKLPPSEWLAVARHGDSQAAAAAPWPEAAPLQARGALWLDQAEHRPGEEVHVQGILWPEVETREPVEITIEDPNGGQVGVWAIKPAEDTPAFEARRVEASLRLPEDAPLGHYSVKMRLGPSRWSTRFLCAPEHRQLLSLAAAWRPSEGPLIVDLTAQLDTLGRLEGWPIRWRARAAPHRLEARDGFVFGLPPEALKEAPVEEGLVLLDGAGRASLNLGELDLARPGGPVDLIVELETYDAERQPVRARLTRALHASKAYVGVRVPEGHLEAGVPFEVALDARTAEGARGEVERVAVRLLDEAGEAVSGCEVEAPGACTLVPPRGGAYTLSARGPQTLTSRALEVRPEPGAGGTPRIYLDKPRYRVGEQALVHLDVPPEGAEVWLTVEGRRLIHQVRARLTPKAAPIALPITAEMLPGAWLRARVLPTPKEGPREPISLERRLEVDGRARLLGVRLSTREATLAPGDPFEVEVRVTNPEGDGIDAEVSLWAIPTGALERPLSEALLEALYAPPEPGAIVEVSNLTPLRASKGEARAAPPLREGLPAPLRAALYVPRVKVDGAGRAVIPLKAPQRLGDLELIALAWGGGPSPRMGVGAAELHVGRALEATLIAPPLARVGDRFGAGVRLIARAPRRVTVTTEISGPARALTAREQVLDLTPGAPQRALFPFHATGRGVAHLDFYVDGAPAQRLNLEIRSPSPLRQKIIYGTTNGRAETALRADEGFHAGVGDVSLTLAASPLGALCEEGVDLLESRPRYLEGLISQVVPLLVFPEAMESRAREGALTRAPAAILEEALARLSALQRPDGGFAYWPGGRQSHPWGSAYALWVLKALERGGAVIAGVDLEEAEAYLKAQTQRPELGDDLKAFAAFVLSEVGEAPNELLAGLRQRAEELPLFGRAFIALADGNKRRARREVNALLEYAHSFAGRVRFTESDEARHAEALHSNTRTTAIILMALLKVEPEHGDARRMVAALLEARRAAKGRTAQDLAFTLLALRRYMEAHEELKEVFTGVVEVGERRVEARFNDPLDARGHRLPLGALGEGLLTFLVEGEGTLHYLARRRYAPLTEETTPTAKGVTLQRWYTTPSTRGRLLSTRVGDKVAVHLRLTTNRPLHYVEIIDAIPGGLRPIEASIQRAPTPSSVQAAPSPTRGAQEPRWYIPFDDVHLERGGLRLFAMELEPGVYEYSYLTEAAVEGTFIAPPARAHALYEAQVHARTESGPLWIHPAEAAPKAPSAQAHQRP